MKKLILWVCGCLCTFNAFSQSRVSVENAFVKVVFQQNEIQLKSKKTQFRTQRLRLEGKILEAEKSLLTDSLWGQGQQLEVKCDNGFVTTLRVFARNPFVQVHSVIHNGGEQSLHIRKQRIASLEIPVAQPAASFRSLGSGGLQPLEKAEGSFSYSLLADAGSYQSVLTAWLTQFQGIGVMEPRWDPASKTYTIESGLDFGHYLVPVGKSRGTDVLMIGFFEDGREGLELYGDFLAKAYGIHLPEKPEVYSTWYHRNLSASGASNEKMLSENTDFVAASLHDYGLNTIQIDDHWQSSMIDGITYNSPTGVKGGIQLNGGPIKNFMKGNENFPSGMQAMADKIHRAGLTPGIWFMPFSGDANSPYCNAEIFAKTMEGKPYTARLWSGTCIDATGPEGEAFLRDRFRTIFGWGYRYWKIDGLHTGAPSENVYVQRAYNGKPLFGEAVLKDSTLTFVQAFRKGMDILNEEAPGVFLLGCSATQNMSSFAGAFGRVHAMRVGPDNDGAMHGKWRIVTTGADFAGNLYFLNNKVWYNDPDPYYVRESNPLEKARWMVSWQAVSGAMSTTSMQYAQLPAERLELIKRGLPTHSLNARPVDILESEKPRIWRVTDGRTFIVGLFNWSDKDSAAVSYPFGRMDLDEKGDYEVFDFWKNAYLGRLSGRLTASLEPAGCKVWSLRKVSRYPQLLSTSRHITQGLMDVKAENWDRQEQCLSGRSRVVKGDRYELRLVVPEQWKVRKATFGDREAEVKVEGRLVRVSFVPDKTEDKEWAIGFDKQ